MFIKLIFFFVGVPALEIYTLIEFGQLIGLGGTLGLIIVTGVSGAYLARSQGMDLLNKIQHEMSEGRVPTEELLDGLLVFAGGLVLLTPGFWTDLIGFILLIPTSRRMIRPRVQEWLASRIVLSSTHHGPRDT